jgi:Uncharacterized alpha/beta hydrolase domain (DUF2235)
MKLFMTSANTSTNNVNVKFGDYKMAKGNRALNVTIGVFFDGTGNNKNNIIARNENSESFQTHGEGNASYRGNYSNVAKLWNCYDAYTLYIDGIGTTSNEADDLALGQAFGTGSTGIPARVEYACKKLSEDYFTPGSKVATITLDVFGFSRGAAAARSFIACLHTSEENNNYPRNFLTKFLKENKITNASGKGTPRIIMRFLGVFDTVSAYSYFASVTPDFSNDIGELGLNTLQNVKKVVHLTARNEHRELFALTRIPIRKGWLEMSMPGIHGDVGGGVTNGIEEIVIAIGSAESLQSQANFLFEAGWYRRGQFIFREFIDLKKIKKFKLVGRRFVSDKYSLIALQVMAYNAINIDKQNTVPILVSRFNQLYGIDDVFLQPIRDLFIKVSTFGGIVNTSLIITTEKKLRNSYLHWSANGDFTTAAGLVMRPAKGRVRLVY